MVWELKVDPVLIVGDWEAESGLGNSRWTFFFFLLSSLELSDTHVHEPRIRVYLWQATGKLKVDGGDTPHAVCLFMNGASLSMTGN